MRVELPIYIHFIGRIYAPDRNIFLRFFLRTADINLWLVFNVCQRTATF